MPWRRAPCRGSYISVIANHPAANNKARGTKGTVSTLARGLQNPIEPKKRGI